MFPAARYPAPTTTTELLRRGKLLEWVTLGWNVVGVAVLAALALSSSSVALAGFGLDSAIEIGASTVVLWELSGTDTSTGTGTAELRQQKALKFIGVAFLLLAIYLLIQSSIALLTAHRASPSIGGVVWLGATAVVMFTLAALKVRTGRALKNPVLELEGRVTLIDGLLAVAVFTGIILNRMLGWWWADPVAGLVIVYYASREAAHIFRPVARNHA